MNIRDKNAKDIEPGQTLRRITVGNCTQVGHRYTVKQRNWKDGGEGKDLIADGGFINELITPERSKEYEIITE
jgi:hypothetical protein